MRIIGGSFRGRRLSAVGKGDAAAHLRPTADRVRENLFNILHSRFQGMDGTRVLDLFAGTGALGLEAVSRGADHATFVESGRTSLKLINDNISLCRVESQTQVLARDARRLGENPNEPYDLIFLDPPYGKSLGEAALAAALDGNWIAQDAMIVWEENQPVIAPDSLSMIDERRYGDTTIRIFTRD